jgi:hypothetical protein
LLFTYIVPLIPLMVLFDGTVSFLRLSLEDDLLELVAGVPGHGTFTWDIGSTSVRGFPHTLTHLIGVPKHSTKTAVTGRGGADMVLFVLLEGIP